MRSGFCAIVGRPNVGKSTFLNRVLGQKLAAVTPKPQTTRHRILGVKNLPDAQIVFVDTPGVHRGKSELNKYMVEQALAAAAETDVVLLMIEAPAGKDGGGTGVGPGQQLIVDALAKLKQPIVLAINKIDRLRDPAQLLPVIERWKELLPFKEIVPMSAQDGTQADKLVELCAALLPEGPRLYPDDVVTDRHERFFAAEAVREQIFLLLKEEIPYDTAVTIERFEERRGQQGGREVAIDATIHLARASQKSIVIGTGGAGVKTIGMRARAELAAMLGCPVHMKLLVAVDPDWTASRGALKRLGYE